MFNWLHSFLPGKKKPITHRRRSRPTVRLLVEALEDRVVPSTSIPLNPVSWTAMGPGPVVNGQVPGSLPVSGRITGLAALPGDPNTVFIATAGGGVWKTTDANIANPHWTALTDNLTDGSGNPLPEFMGSIAIAPSNTSVIYAGTGEANNSGDSFYGRGILKSSDGGSTWSLLGNAQFNRTTIAKVVVDPQDANRVYVAVDGFGANGINSFASLGIWRTTDGGASWVHVLNPAGTPVSGSNPQISDLTIDPTTTGAAGVLYAGFGTYFGDSGNGVYKSTDGGATWARAGDFLTVSGSGATGANLGRISIAVSPSSSQTIYASVSDPVDYSTEQILKSTNGGENWSVVMSDNRLHSQTANFINYMGGQGWYDQTLIVDPTSANIVYAAGQGGPGAVIKSSDGGATWTAIDTGVSGLDGPHADHHAIGFDAAGKLLDGDDGGIWRLNNPAVGSIQWADLNGNLQTVQFTGIALDPTTANIVYGGSQDNGTEKFTDSLGWSLSRGGDGGFVRVDFTNPLTIYHTFFYSTTFAFIERSDDGGLTWNGVGNGIGAADLPALGDEEDPSRFYPPFVMDPSNSSRLLLGTDHLYETTNKGGLWTAIGTPNANGFNPLGKAVDTIGVSHDGGTIYVSAGGHNFVTTNHGALWTAIDVPGFTDGFNEIAVDPAASQTAYIVRNRFSAGAGGHVFKTTNGGATWTDISNNNGLPNLPTNAVIVDSATHILYVGTDAGVYRSTNGGATWSRFGAGIPNAQIVQLEVNDSLNILAAGTHGRGLWEVATTNTLVSLDSSNNLVVADTAVGGKADTLTIKSDNTQSQFIISDPNNFISTGIAGATGDGTHSVTVPFAAVTGPQIQVNTMAGSDSLTVDESLGLFSKTITYDGGADPDALTLADSSALTSVAYDATGAGAGDFVVNGDTNHKIFFSNLTPTSVTALVGTVTINVDPGNLLGTITTTLTGSGGNNTATFDNGLESLTYANPTVALVVNGHSTADQIALTSLGAGFNAALTVNGNAGADTLTVNLAVGNPIPASGLTFNGGGDSGDTLAISAGSFNTDTYNYTNAHDGNVQLDPDGPGGAAPSVISYTGLAPISNTGAVVNVILNLTAVADDVTLLNLGGGVSRLQPNNASLEQTDFTAPTGSLAINGLGGADLIHLQSLPAGITTTIDGGSGVDRLFGPNLVNLWNLTGAAQGNLAGVVNSFTSIEELVGGTASDTLAGPNAINRWSITGANAGSILNILNAFSSMENLTGNADSDFFTFANAGSITGAIDGGAGFDTLTGPNLTNSWNVTGAFQGNLTGIVPSFISIESLAGGTGLDTLLGNNAANIWNITGANGGFINGVISVFSSMENLTGNAGNDIFNINNTGSVTGVINGGAGLDQLLGPNLTNAWTLTGVGQGSITGVVASFLGFETLTGGAGSDTLIGINAASIWNVTAANAGNIAGVLNSFTGFENLTGGSAQDVFRFGSAGSISGVVRGGAGSNWLDYSAIAGSVAVNLGAGTATRITGGVQNFNNVIGSAVGGDQLTGTAAGGVLVGHGAGNTLRGGAGLSVLIGGFGLNTLVGGARDDILINGRTIYDGNVNSLESILATWQNGMSYTLRVAALRPTLAIGPAVVVFPGVAARVGPRFGRGGVVVNVATLFGVGGTNWFITNSLLSVADRKTGEVVTTP